MDDQLKAGLQNILQKNRIIWGTVLTGMIGLILFSLAFYYFEVIDHLPIVRPKKADNVTLLVILIFVLIIFYIKQTILIPSKLIEKSKKQNLVLHAKYSILSQNGDEKRITFLKCVQIFNRNMLVVWFLADMVVLSAFINFILAPIVNKLLMYSFVGLFSLIINFPSSNLYKKIYRYIYE